MSDNVRWEPVEFAEMKDEWVDATDPNRLEYHDNDDGRYFVASGRGEYVIDDDYALCRAVAAPTWSQEVPTEAGDWWVWDGDDRKAWAGVRLARIYREADDVLWITARFIFRTPLSTMPPTVWYAPATVPQPPTGEVGP